MNNSEDIELTEFPVLKTERLVLREAIPDDAADYFVFRSDPYVQRFNMKPLETVEQARKMIEEDRAVYLRTDGIGWAITLKGQDTVIGAVVFSAWSIHNRAMLGYDLARAYWGRGIGTEAATAVIRYGFEYMGLNRIDADTIEDNHESRRMLEKLGFTCEGIRRGYSLEDDGEYHGSTINGLLRSDYYPYPDES